MDTQNSNTLTLWENQCSACSKFHRLLAAKTREPWKKYDQVMATARDYVGACIRGNPAFRRVTDQDTERIAFRLWGRCGTFFENK